MCSFRYGWTDATTQILKNTDLVYLFTDLVSVHRKPLHLSPFIYGDNADVYVCGRSES